jgi:DHA2 family multidrug resistance protein
MIPLVFTTAFFFFTGKQRVIAAATIGAVASLAPTLGPVIGGWITDISLALAVLHQPGAGDFRRRGRADAGKDRPAGTVAAQGRGLLEHGVSRAVSRLPGIHPRRRPRWNWFSDQTILTTAWISGLAGLALSAAPCTWPIRSSICAHQGSQLRPRLLLFFVTGIGLFATIYLTPLFLGRVRGYSALDIGLAVFSTGVFQIMAIPLYAFRQSHGPALDHDAAWACLPCRCGSSVRSPTTGGRELMLPQALRGIAQQLAVPPAVTLTLGGLAPAR